MALLSHTENVKYCLCFPWAAGNSKKPFTESVSLGEKEEGKAMSVFALVYLQMNSLVEQYSQECPSG